MYAARQFSAGRRVVGGQLKMNDVMSQRAQKHRCIAVKPLRDNGFSHDKNKCPGDHDSEAEATSLFIAQLHLLAPNRLSIAYEEIVATKDGREKHEDVQKKSKARGNFWRFLWQSIGRRSATGVRRCRGERIVWQKRWMA
jgi:hypothetical protein